MTQSFQQLNETMYDNPGYWLNPKTGAFFQVVTHETWIHDPNNAQKIGLASSYYDELSKLPLTDLDGIRLLAIKGGLVRTRKARNSTTVQFEATRNRVRNTLYAIADMLRKVTISPHEQLWINNVLNNDDVHITLSDFLKKIKDGEQIMIFENNLQPILAVEPNPELLKRLASALDRIAKQQ